jgi:hypothetical protein
VVTNIKSYPNLIDDIWKISIVTPLENRNPADRSEMIVLFPSGSFRRIQTIERQHLQGTGASRSGFLYPYQDNLY